MYVCPLCRSGHACKATVTQETGAWIQLILTESDDQNVGGSGVTEDIWI